MENEIISTLNSCCMMIIYSNILTTVSKSLTFSYQLFCRMVEYAECTSNSCNMGARDLPDMYAQGPQARGLRTYISGESRAPMLQVLCMTSSILKICLTYRLCFAYLYDNEYSF